MQASIALLISLLLLPLAVFAAPDISSVSGTASNGESITITGSGFGAGPSIVIFDDFEKGADGNQISEAADGATVGGWTDTTTTCGCQTYSDDQALSGSMSFRAVNGSGYSQTNPHITKTFSAATEFFCVYNVYIPSDDVWPGYGATGETNWKIIWLHSGNVGLNCEDDTDLCVVISGDKESASRGAPVAGNCPGLINGTYNDFYKGRWNRQALYIYADNTIPESRVLGYHLVRGVGTNTYFDTDNDAEPEPSIHPTYRGNGEISHTYTMFDLNGYQRQNAGSNVTSVYYDDVYLATGPNCMARVEIGDNAVYTSCTNLAICTPTSWGSSSITATVRQGSFSDGTAYLFVVDADGVVSDGYEITLGGSTPASGSSCTASGTCNWQ